MSFDRGGSGAGKHEVSILPFNSNAWQVETSLTVPVGDERGNHQSVRSVEGNTERVLHDGADHPLPQGCRLRLENTNGHTAPPGLRVG